MTRRADGSRQVTYAGRPLYHYVGYSAPLQILCQNVREFGGLARRAPGRDGCPLTGLTQIRLFGPLSLDDGAARSGRRPRRRATEAGARDPVGRARPPGSRRPARRAAVGRGSAARTRRLAADVRLGPAAAPRRDRELARELVVTEPEAYRFATELSPSTSTASMSSSSFRSAADPRRARLARGRAWPGPRRGPRGRAVHALGRRPAWQLQRAASSARASTRPTLRWPSST